MVSTCTQFKYWTFPNDTELNRLREEANRKFIASRTSDEESEHVISENFLNAAEEFKLYFHYSKLLDDFCRDFQPPMPGYVLGTAMSYFKRFYLHNSVMDYHPRYVTYTCVYLACKVEEFNVSVQQFVGNIANTKHERYLLGGEAANGDFDRFEELTSIVINFEMLLMHQLRYHLTVHNPYRPLEGLLIDIKANCGIGDDSLRPVASKLLQKTLFTDAILVFTPSQLALAAVMYAARKANVDIKNYVSEKLFAPNNSGGSVPNYEELTERIFKLISEAEKKPSREEVQRIEHKLMRCQNVENDPRSVEYKRRMIDELQEDDQEPVVKKFRTSDDDDF